MTSFINAAVIQQSVVSNDKQINNDKTAYLIRHAVNQGSELIVLQELHATQYFCQTEDVSNFDLAEPLSGATYLFFEALAKELDIVLVISGFEVRAPGLYHNTAQVIDGVHGFAGKYRKMHIPDDPGFYEKFYFTPGDASPPFYGFEPIQTRVGKLGVLVCWDQWFPEAARLMALAGADFLIYPTAIGWDKNDCQPEQKRQLDAWITVQRAHAIANGIPVLVANRAGFEQSSALEQSSGLNRSTHSALDEVQSNGIQFWGHSFIAGPQGELLAQADEKDHQIITATLSKEKSQNVRQIWPFFRDRRVDAYHYINARWID